MLRLQFADGRGIDSPALRWQLNSPRAKSLTLWLEAPHADRPRVYWLVFNLPAHDGELDARNRHLPPGARLGTNSFGSAVYLSPCVEQGAAGPFRFCLAAVDAVLPLSEGVSLRQVQKAMHEHVLERAALDVACGGP